MPASPTPRGGSSRSRRAPRRGTPARTATAKDPWRRDSRAILRSMAFSYPAPISDATPDDIDHVLAFWRRASDHESVSETRASMYLLLDILPACFMIDASDGECV